jgi:hypothetical protein
MGDNPVPDTENKIPLQSVCIRMFRQGLGDCFLLTFNRSDAKKYNLLVDCGVLPISGGDGRLKQIVKVILQDCEGHIDAVAATHEHADHISGFQADSFNLAAPGQPSIPAKIDQVWLAWTENTQDEQVKEILRRANALSLTVAAALMGMDKAQSQPIRDFLLFAGDTNPGAELLSASGKKKSPKYKVSVALDKIMDYLRQLAPPPIYLEQKDVIEHPEFGFRVYCLGPSRQISMFGGQATDGNQPEHALKLNRTTAFMAAAVKSAGFSIDTPESGGVSQSDINELFEMSLPFSSTRSLTIQEARTPIVLGKDATYPEKIEASYRDFYKKIYGYGEEKAGHGPEWRRIDTDWLQMGGDLALQQVSLVNNTSLVLAIELIDSGKVLLFAGDAERENWQTWKNEHADVKDLLARTVVYKVGHHGSINATDPQMFQAEMTNPELVALIPTDEARARIKEWKFPDPSLYNPSKANLADKGLLYQQTGGRVIVNCVEECKDCSPDYDPAKKWPGVIYQDPSADMLWVDYTLIL